MSGFRWSTERFDQLEAAVRAGKRVVLERRGSEFVVTAIAVRTVGSKDHLIGRVSMTGEELSFVLDELDGFQVIE